MEALAAIQQLNNAAAFAPTQISTPEYTPTIPNTGSEPPLYSPPPTVPPQYRQEVPQPSEQPQYSPQPVIPPQYRQEVPQQSVSSTPASTDKPPIGAGFYFQWIAANIGALIVAAIVQMSLHTGVPNLLRRLLMMAGAGATIGGMQSLVLRQQIPLSEKWWIGGTTIGFVVSVFLIRSNPYDAVGWSGPIVGIIQWWILRRYVKQSGWWVLVNTFFGGLGGIMSGAVLILLLGNKKSLESKKP
jgi:serine/threonine-protein kinase